jgi:hypothetical protein
MQRTFCCFFLLRRSMNIERQRLWYGLMWITVAGPRLFAKGHLLSFFFSVSSVCRAKCSVCQFGDVGRWWMIRSVAVKSKETLDWKK